MTTYDNLHLFMATYHHHPLFLTTTRAPSHAGVLNLFVYNVRMKKTYY